MQHQSLGSVNMHVSVGFRFGVNVVKCLHVNSSLCSCCFQTVCEFYSLVV